jgi:cytochrome c
MVSMRMVVALVFAAALAAPVAGCGEPQPDVTVDAGDPAAASDTSSGASSGASGSTNVALGVAPPAFGICRSCHSVEKGQTVVGPSLFGVYGTRAGDVPGYDFTPDLKASGLVWNDATLDKWLTNPVALVPGTRMGYAGQPDPEKRRLIIAYLKSLH